MREACPSVGGAAPLVRRLADGFDCQLLGLSHSGFEALFAPSGGFGAVLTGALTIVVAILGYRMLLGRSTVSVSEFAISAVKIGAVLALCTRWDLYQSLVYGLLTAGPQEISQRVLQAMEVQGPSIGGVLDLLQSTLDQLQTAAALYARQASPAASPLVGGVGFAALTLNLSGAVLFFNSLGVLVAAKVVLAFLISTGPIFILLFLFETTRGWFVAWLRASAAFSLAALAVPVLLALFLGLLSPLLNDLSVALNRSASDTGPVMAIAAVISIEALVMTLSLGACAMVAAGLSLPRRTTATSLSPSIPGISEASFRQESRAASIARAVSAAARAETMPNISDGDRRTRIAMVGAKGRSEIDRLVPAQTTSLSQPSAMRSSALGRRLAQSRGLRANTSQERGS